MEIDVQSGIENRRSTLPIFVGEKVSSVCALPGMQKLFVVTGGQQQTYRILDVSNGSTLAGPFAMTGDWINFSPDGKWLQLYHKIEPCGFEIIETMTGQFVWRTTITVDRRPVNYLRFSPASDAVAIHWVSKNNKSEVEVRELPTGRTCFTQELPTPSSGEWYGLRQWEQNRLYMKERDGSRIVGIVTSESWLLLFELALMAWMIRDANHNWMDEIQILFHTADLKLGYAVLLKTTENDSFS